MKKKVKVTAMIFCSACAVSALFALAACEKDSDSQNTEKQVTSISVDFTPKEVYVRNEAIDYSSVEAIVNYSDGSQNTYTAEDEEISVEGGDTSAAGTFTLTVTYSDPTYDFINKSEKFTYTVRDTRMTLILGDGSLSATEGSTLVAETPDNYTSLADYAPVANDPEKEFAGWFYDAAFTRPVQLNFEEKADTSSDVTFYAGYDIDYGNLFEYEENDGEITLVSLNADFGDYGVLKIPATIKLRPVTKIAALFISYDAAWSANYSGLEFAENSAVKEIGYRAFGARSLKTISLPESLVKIGEEAFVGVKITKIDFPDSLERIETGAFSMATALKEVNFGENSKLNHLGSEAFSYCSTLSYFEVPDNVSTIGDLAFQGCEALVYVKLGANVRSVGLHAFMGDSALIRFEVDRANKHYRAIDSDLYSADGKKFIRYCFGKQEETFTMANGVTDIEESAFDALNLNASLQTIVLPESLETIWQYAFRDCEAKFVIPANVKNIAANAFAQCQISGFSVDENNKYFAVKDGALYTKDFKELVAIPTKTENKTFTLDERTEKIRSGAMTANSTLKYFVIPENSALTRIDEHALVLGAAKELCGVYIEKKEPFAIDMYAFAGSGMSLSEGYLIYIDSSAYSAYADKWAGALVSGEDAYTQMPLADYTVAYNAAGARVLADIAKLLEADGFTDTEDLSTKFDEWSGGMSVTGYVNFIEIYQKLDGLYESGEDISSVKEYLAVFEKKSMNFIVSQYLTYNDYTFGSSKSFYKPYAHYLHLPEDIKAGLDGLQSDFTSLLKKTDEVIELLQYSVDEAAALVADIGHFDLDKANTIYGYYTQYTWGLLSAKWSDTINMYKVRCSILINEFLNTPIEIDSLDNLRTLLDGENYELGIEGYLESYLSTSVAREQIYQYSEFEAAYKRYLEMIAGINADMANFGFEDFDYGECEQILINYWKLRDDEITLAAREAYPAVYMRYLVEWFAATEITEEMYTAQGGFCDVYSQIRTMLAADEDIMDKCMIPESTMLAFGNRKAELFAFYETKHADLIGLLNSLTAENLTEKGAQISELFESALLADDHLMTAAYSLTAADGKKGDIDLVCYSVIRCYLIKNLLADYSEVTDENRDEIALRINGDYWMGVSGIVDYEFSEDFTIRVACEEIFLSEAELEAYYAFCAAI